MAKYIKGLNKDTAPIDQPEGSYRYAKNVLSNETAGAISNEPGTSVINQVLDNNELVIGSIETTEDKVVLYTVDSDTNRSRIYLYDATIDSVTVVLQTTSGNVVAGNDVDLKFDKRYPIEGTYKIDPNGDLIAYWTDNFNPPRSLNITRQTASNNTFIYGVDPATSPNTNYIDRINLFPHSGPVPRISFDRIANGGALKSGTYTLFLAYVDENFTQTNFVSYSLAVPIVEDDESVRPIERYDGCEPDTQTGKSIVWEVDNLNTDYEFLRPIIVHRTLDKDSAPAEFAFKLNDLDISSGTATVVFSGLEGYESSSVEEAIIDTVAYDTAKTITQLDSILYIFLRSVDVTDDGGQFCDRGESYRTAIFIYNKLQNEKAQVALKEAQKELNRKIVTPIIKLEKFYIAEDYHQDYYKGENIILTRYGPRKQSSAYKLYRKSCRRDDAVKKLWGSSAQFTK